MVLRSSSRRFLSGRRTQKEVRARRYVVVVEDDLEICLAVAVDIALDQACHGAEFSGHIAKGCRADEIERLGSDNSRVCVDD